MTVAVPIVGTSIVGLAVGCLLALTYGRPLARGALWGAGGGLAFGIAAAIILAVSPWVESRSAGDSVDASRRIAIRWKQQGE